MIRMQTSRIKSYNFTIKYMQVHRVCGYGYTVYTIIHHIINKETVLNPTINMFNFLRIITCVNIDTIVCMNEIMTRIGRISTFLSKFDFVLVNFFFLD